MMAANSLPLDDLELEDEEIEGFIVSSNKKRVVSAKRQQIPWQWVCLLGLLACIALFLAIIAVMLYAHHVRATHGVPTESVNHIKHPIDGKTVETTVSPKEISDVADTSEASAATETPVHQAPAITATNKAAEIDFAKGDAWQPAPFTVQTENPPEAGVMQKYSQDWGTWQLERPTMDRNAFCGDDSHCDVSRDKFPADAWQSDSAYVNKFLDEADKLVDRAMNAILAEYGKAPTETEMFDLTYREDLKRRELGGPSNNGGWTTKRSMQGLARRLLHAIITRDTFTFVMGGHSAAAGHG